MDSVVDSALEEICCGGANGLHLRSLWAKISPTLPARGLPICPNVKRGVWENLVEIPGLKLVACDGAASSKPTEVLINCTVEECEEMNVKIVAPEATRRSFLGIYEMGTSESISTSISAVVVNRNTFEEYKSMEDDIFSGVANGQQIESKVVQTFQKSFVQVQNILDQNRLLISEINLNHESKTPVNLTRNVGLIRELNNNIRRVVDLYTDLSNSFTKSMEASSEAESKSDTRGGQKRVRSGN